MTGGFARQARLLDYTLRALGRHRARNLALLAVYTAVIFVLASVMLFAQALKGEAAALLQHSPEVLVQKLAAGRHALASTADLAVVGDVRGVSAASGRLWGYFFDPVAAANYTLMVPPDRPPGARQVVIGDGVARARGLAAGNPLALRSPSGALHAYTVERVLSDASSLVSADLILMNEVDYRSFFELPAGVFTDLVFTVTNPQEVRTVATKIAAKLPGSRVILREELLRTYESLFNWREGLLLAVAGLSLLAFVILAWTKAAGLSADEAREIGILKAIGWDTTDVLQMKLWEGLLVSGFAFLAGYVAAHVHVFHLGAPLLAPLLKGWATLYPRFDLAPTFDGLQLLTLGLLAILPYTLTTLVPSWRAAITDPDAAMRGTY
jgi:ABC-type lipoprotein release transport system permease subunit